MVLSQTIPVRVNGRTAKRYRELGYSFAKIGDIIDVKYTDLSQYSEEYITVRCDYCGKIFNRQFGNHYRIVNSGTYNHKDACKDCKMIKTQDIIKERYGVNHVFEIPEVLEKVRKTVHERYGVDNVSSLPEIRQKVLKTNFERYGTNFPSQTEAIKEKVRETNRVKYGADYYTQTAESKHRFAQTCLKKYGVATPLQSDTVKQKIKETCMARYGCANPSSTPAVRQKVAQTKYANSSQTSSRQQRYLHDVVGGEFNYPFGRYFLDIAFPDQKIAVEYNGSGHDLSVRLGQITENKFIQNETYRKKQLYAGKWRLITWISHSDKLPSAEQIRHLHNFAMSLLQERHWVEIDLDHDLVRTSQQSYPFTQISLRD